MAKIAKKLSQVSQQAMDRLDLPVNLASRRGPHGAAGQPVALYRPAPRRAGVQRRGGGHQRRNGGGAVQGEGLELVVMTDEELRINGVIRQLQLVE